jgi:glycosyltransferase involved in cell wall biosynthesis
MAISGGTELNAVRTIERLQELNDIVVLTFNGAGGMASRYERADIEVCEFPILSLVGRHAWQQMNTMAAFLRGRRIDIVHAHDCYSNFMATVAARLAGTRGIVASKRWTRTLRWQHRWTNLMAYRLAHRVLANSAEVGRSLHTSDFLPEKRIVVVPNFVDDERFVPYNPIEIQQHRNRLGYTDEHVVIAIVAQLRTEKCHAALIAAFEKCLRQNPQLRLLLVGDGPERERITALVQSLHLESVVTLAGHMSDGVLAHSIADISVLVSAHEGFPNSLVEAMAASRPVVATKVGGVVDAVEDGVTGILVPYPEWNRLEQALLQLGADAALRQRMGEAGRARAWNQFRRSLVIPQLQQLYAGLVTE